MEIKRSDLHLKYKGDDNDDKAIRASHGEPETVNREQCHEILYFINNNINTIVSRNNLYEIEIIIKEADSNYREYLIREVEQKMKVFDQNFTFFVWSKGAYHIRNASLSNYTFNPFRQKDLYEKHVSIHL